MVRLKSYMTSKDIDLSNNSINAARSGNTAYQGDTPLAVDDGLVCAKQPQISFCSTDLIKQQMAIFV